MNRRNLLLFSEPRKKKKLPASLPLFSNSSAMVWQIADFPQPIGPQSQRTERCCMGVEAVLFPAVINKDSASPSPPAAAFQASSPPTTAVPFELIILCS